MEMMKYVVDGIEAPTMEDVNRMLEENILSFTRTLYLPEGLSLPLVNEIAREKFIQGRERNFHWLRVREATQVELYTEGAIKRRDNKLYKEIVGDLKTMMEDEELWQ